MSKGRLVFYTDENLSHRVAGILKLFDPESNFRLHRDEFEQGAEDSYWISEVARWNPKPIVLAGDGRILKNRVEKQALKHASLTYVYLSSGWMNIGRDEFVIKILRAWPGIKAKVAKVNSPTIFEVRAGSSRKVECRGLTSQL